MIAIPNLHEELKKLNDAQRDAADHIDGPLLVIAGPGTGKTQLLGVRTANILANRDVKPREILCLTFTNSGTDAMRKRLITLIGREAYGVDVFTFHGFASSLRSRYPEFFPRKTSMRLVTDLRQKEIIDSLLLQLPLDSPLRRGSLKGVLGFFKTFRKSGLTTDEYRAIQKQTLGFMEWVEENHQLLALASQDLPKSDAKKKAYAQSIAEEVARIRLDVPEQYRNRIGETPGIYEPFASYLVSQADRFGLAGEDAVASDCKGFRDCLFSDREKDGHHFKDKGKCQRGIAAADLYDQYRNQLDEEGLYDFDDMISDALKALREFPDLRAELRDRYSYIQVDEFQDTNGSQMRIVDYLFDGAEHPNIMVVGDDDQAIMRFQGASLGCIQQFKDKYHPEEIPLEINYRSTPALVDLGKAIACQVENRLQLDSGEKQIAAYQKESEQAEFVVHCCESRAEQYHCVAQDIRNRIDEGFIDECEDSDVAIAVIATEHQSLRDLIPHLRRFNVPYSYTYKSNVSQMECMQTLLASLRFVAAYSRGNEAAAASELPRIAASPEVGLSHKDCIDLAIAVKREHKGRWIDAVRTAKNRRLKRFFKRLEECSAKAPSSPVRALIVELAAPLADYYRSCAEDEPLEYAEFNSGIRALIEFAKAEVEEGAVLGHALRIADVVDCLEKAEQHKVAIDASVTVGGAGSVQLCTAHASKGLEFDLVYLVDADNASWHKIPRRTLGVPGNVFIADERDEDDERRLLFVAITRAKRRLETYKAGGFLVQELEGLVTEEQVDLGLGEVADAIETDWKSMYAFDTPELRKLLKPVLSNMELSASALNNFVHYERGCTNSEDFPANRVAQLPQAPKLATEFGTLVHSFMEDYVNRVRKANDLTLEKLADDYRSGIRLLDFGEDELDWLARRFERIVGDFIPYFDGYVSGRLVTEAGVRALVDDVPLNGRCDLLAIDDERREIKVVDYKTGRAQEKVDDNYTRQLQFYRLLLENSPDYHGYKVVECIDLFVEPETDQGEVKLHEPQVTNVSDEQVAHVRELVSAVWRRIQSGDFDTSAFEESAHYIEATKKKDGTRSKRINKSKAQAAYEQWLIEETH